MIIACLPPVLISFNVSQKLGNFQNKIVYLSTLYFVVSKLWFTSIEAFASQPNYVRTHAIIQFFLTFIFENKYLALNRAFYCWRWKSSNLSSFSSDSSCQLDILWHNGDSFGVDSAQVGIFEKSDEISFGSFLKSHDS